MAKDFITINPAKVRQLAERSSPALIARTTERVALTARLLAPGTMKEHIRVIVSPTGGGLGIVMSDHPATTFVIYKTQPHVIVAKRGKALKFTVAGQDFYRRKVNHPGNQHPNNFLLKALEAAKF